MKRIEMKYKLFCSRVFMLLAFFTFLFAFHIQAQEQNDARYKKIVKEYTLHEDGRFSMKYEQELEYLSYYAIHRKYGETSVIYNPKVQKVDIDYAYTIMKDGKKVETPENAFNEVLPHQATNAPAYNHLRRLVVTHTGLEIGAVSHLSYTLTSNNESLPALMGKERIYQSAPCDELIIRIKFPKSLQMTFSLKNIGPWEIDTSSEEGFNVHTFAFNDLPAYSLEPHQPHPSVSEPYFQFSNKSMKELYFSFISQKAFRFEMNEKMMKWVDDIEESSEGQLQLILNLQEKIANNIATYPLSLAHTQYRVRTPQEVFMSRAGTKLEKAAFMVACLQYKGIKAFPIMVSSHYKMDENVGVLDAFDDFVVRINQGQSFLYLPVDFVPDFNLKYSLSRKSLVAIYNGISMFEIKEEPVFNNFASLFADIRMGDKVDLLAKNEAGFNPWIRIIKNQKAGFNNLYAGISVQNNEKSKADVYELNSYASEYELDAQLKSSTISKQDNYFFLTLPHYNLGIASWHLDINQVERKTMFEIPSKAKEEYDFKIKLNKGDYFSKKKYTVVKNNNVGELTIDIKLKRRKAHIKKSIVFNRTLLNNEDYLHVREMIILWNSDEFNTLIYKKK